MPNAPNKNPFKGYQVGKVSKRKDQIEQILKALGRSKFDSVTALAETVAYHLTELERAEYEKVLAHHALADADGGRVVRKPRAPRPVSKVTLMRNGEYLSLLLQFLSKKGIVQQTSKGPRSKAVEDLSHELELRNLKAEVARLRRYIEKVEDNKNGGQLANDEGDVWKEQNLELKEKVRLLANAINRITRYPQLGQFFVVDHENRILEVSKGIRRSQPLLKQEEVEVYFDVMCGAERLDR
ncbi:hypothetical protein [Thioalkalivibrio versutus]|nr:hypothetical protein [Thioalkalivibrio versutus]